MDLWFTGRGQRYDSYPEHSHGYWEILLNLEGMGILKAEEQEYPFQPGTIFCIRPGIRHSKSAEGGFLDRSILVRDFCFENTDRQILVFQDDENGSFRTLCHVADSIQSLPTGNAYAERCLRSILDAMQNLLCLWKDVGQLNPEVARVQKVLYAHAKDPNLDLAAVVTNTNYSPNHFRTLFHSQCGSSPTRYLNQVRVQMAKQLLLQDQTLTIAQVSGQCGFRDPYYFSRVFKQVAGVSPSRFCEQSKRLEAERLATDMDPLEYPY